MLVLQPLPSQFSSSSSEMNFKLNSLPPLETSPIIKSPRAVFLIPGSTSQIKSPPFPELSFEESSEIPPLELDPGSSEFLYDRDNLWYQNLDTDLRKYLRKDIENAASELYKSSIPAPTKRTYTKDLKSIIKAVRMGNIFIPLIPALNYLNYFNDENGIIQWSKMSLGTLRQLAIYYGYLNEDDINNYNRTQLLILMTTTAIKVTLNQARYMGIYRFKHYLSSTGLGEAQERDIHSLYDYYEQYYQVRPKEYAINLGISNIQEKPYRPLNISISLSNNFDQVTIQTNEEIPLTIDEITTNVIPFNSTNYISEQKFNLLKPVNSSKAVKSDLETYLFADIVPQGIAEMVMSLNKTELLQLMKFEVNEMSLDDIRQFLICWMIQPLLPYEKIFRKLLITGYDVLIRSITDIVFENFSQLFIKEIINDRLSLIFALATFQLPIFNTVIPFGPEYEMRHRLNNEQLKNVTNACYSYDNINTYFRFLIKYEVRNIEPFIYKYANGANVSELAKYKNFMIIPEFVTDKRQYFIENICEYENVFKRRGKPSVPVGKQLETLSIAALSLSVFTDTELVEVFGNNYNWSSRADFIRQLALSLTASEDLWTFANNPDLSVNPYSIINLENKNFNDPSDPIISYGRLTAYRSYNLSELVAAFQPRELPKINSPDTNGNGKIQSPKLQKEGEVVFLNPSYNNPSRINNPFADFEHIDELRIFPLKSMGQLLFLLRKNVSPLFTELISLIEKGLNSQVKINRYLKALRDNLDSLNSEEMDNFKEYTYKLFILSMYARFWKGPPEKYQYAWIDDGRNNRSISAEEGRHLANTAERALNYTKYSIEITDLIKSMTTKTRNIVDNIFILEYDWISGLVRSTNTLFMDIFRDSLRCQMCIAELSDRGIKTAYVLISRVLNHEDSQMNQMLRNILQNENQPDFIPVLMELTLHKDPQHEIVEQI